MSTDQNELTGRDLEWGIALSEIPDGGMRAGHADGKPVLLARRCRSLHAASTSTWRQWLLPALVIDPSRWRPPLA